MEKVFKIDGMSCQHCVMAVKNEIEKLNVVHLDVKVGEAKVKFDETKTNEESIRKSIVNAGYTVID